MTRRPRPCKYGVMGINDREIMLRELRNGTTWEVVGPPDLIYSGATVKGWIPSTNKFRTVTIGWTAELNDGRTIGHPKAKACGGHIKGSTCVLPYAHPGWCKP